MFSHFCNFRRRGTIFEKSGEKIGFLFLLEHLNLARNELLILFSRALCAEFFKFFLNILDGGLREI